jgi:hypothetical protein
LQVPVDKLPHEKLGPACICVDTFLQDIQAVEAIATEIPILVVWNMNCGQPQYCQVEKSWKPKVEAIKSIITAHPASAVALVVPKKSGVSSSGTRSPPILSIVESH